MDERGQFTFYASIFESAKRMKNKSARADFYDAVCDYALNGIIPDLDKLADSAAVGFISVKPNLDASRKKAKSGKAGGSSKQTESKLKANRKQTESEKEGEKEKEKEKENEIEKEIENECYISPKTEGANTGDGIGAPPFDGRLFTDFWKLYPAGKGGDREEAWKAWKELSPTADVANRILYGLREWVDSDQWAEDGGRYIPSAAKFLKQERWKAPPEVAAPIVGEDGLTDGMREYIRKMQEDKAKGVGLFAK